MKKEYVKPEVEYISLEAEDIITIDYVDDDVYIGGNATMSALDVPDSWK